VKKFYGLKEAGMPHLVAPQQQEDIKQTQAGGQN
jgi:hypothetical protein